MSRNLGAFRRSIRKAREVAGLTKRQAAGGACMGYERYCDVEDGRKAPTLREAIDLTAEFGMSLEDAVTG